MSASTLNRRPNNPQPQAQCAHVSRLTPSAQRLLEHTRSHWHIDSWDLHRAARRTRVEAIGEAVGNAVFALARAIKALWTHPVR